MTKNNEFEISIHLDAVTVAYLETLLSFSGDSCSKLFRDLVKEYSEESVNSETCYNCALSTEFDIFPRIKHYFICMDEESLSQLDRLVAESGLSRTAVLRGLVIRTFKTFQLTFREVLHELNGF